MEKITILCVDDQRDVLLSVARDLQALSAWTTIEECESADEAEQIIDELDAEGRPLGLIVCDHIMPGITGVEFLTQVENTRHLRHVKKVLITGQATHNDTINAINQAKIDGYIEKPWDPEELRGLCLRLLTEYLFDARKDIDSYRSVADPQVLLSRMRGRE